MNENIFIPEKCKVGFNTRADTYTGKLGYIICHDGKKWRKEPSWEGWREKYMDTDAFNAQKKIDYDKTLKMYIEQYNWSEKESLKRLGSFEQYRSHSMYKVSGDKSVEPIEFTNEPTEGFVLNKKVGGNTGSWNPRATYTRVYDPRGFEFEISIPNLLYILENTNSIKGKGLEGNFVYGWQGKDLMLIPECAPEYKKMVEYTELQDGKVSIKDLKPAMTYLDKQQNEWVYLGKFKEYIKRSVWESTNVSGNSKYVTKRTQANKHYFFNKKYGHTDTKSGISFLAKSLEKEDHLIYNEQLAKLEKEERFVGFGTYFLEDIKTLPKDNYTTVYFEKAGILYSIYYSTGYHNSKILNSSNIHIVLAIDTNDTTANINKSTDWRESAEESLGKVFPEFKGKEMKDLPSIYQLKVKKLKLPNGKIVGE